MAPIATNTDFGSEVSPAAGPAIQIAGSVALNNRLSPSNMNGLDASALLIEHTNKPKDVPAPDSAAARRLNVCTDHMITCKWSVEEGWQSPKLEPYGPLSLMPTASCLHYATECFEGLKLYRGFDGHLRLFRPSRNTHRMVGSATRIGLPSFDPDELEKLIVKLCATDAQKWLPTSRPGNFLYVRPTTIGTGDSLGFKQPNEALLYIILCCFPCFNVNPGLHYQPVQEKNNTTEPKIDPWGTSGAAAGLKLLASREDSVRAWHGGAGWAKLGSNYGPTIVAQTEAREMGLDQVLWLLGKERYVTEAGASNFMVVWRTREGELELVTAPLEAKIILDGVTRRSTLELARERLSTSSESFKDHPHHLNAVGLEPLEVVEKEFTINDICSALDEGRLVEAFVVGTAYFVTPVSLIVIDGRVLNIPMVEGSSGTYAAVLKKWLWNIMYGKESHRWGVVIDEEQSLDK